MSVCVPLLKFEVNHRGNRIHNLLCVNFHTDGASRLWLFLEFNSYDCSRIVNVEFNYNDEPIRKAKFYANYIDENQRIFKIDVNQHDE